MIVLLSSFPELEFRQTIVAAPIVVGYRIATMFRHIFEQRMKARNPIMVVMRHSRHSQYQHIGPNQYPKRDLPVSHP